MHWMTRTQGTGERPRYPWQGRCGRVPQPERPMVSTVAPGDEALQHRLLVVLGTVCLLLVLLARAGRVQAAETILDTARIEHLTGVKGELNVQEGVFKVSMPRADLAVTIAGVTMTPPMGLTSWAAFHQVGAQTLVMGDMVLLEDQVNPVMSVALRHGLEVTALHNHFFWDTPKVMFMHIGGTGTTEALAGAVGHVFTAIRETSGGKDEHPQAALDPARTSLHPQHIEEILGVKGQMADGVYKVSLGRSTRMHDHNLGNAMGVNTWAAFVGSDAQAVVDGDFAMLESELQPVLKALRDADISVVAIHQHMTMEVPRLVFLHYWGLGTTHALATGLKAALDIQQDNAQAR